MIIRSLMTSVAAFVLMTGAAAAEDTRTRSFALSDYDLTNIEDVDRLHHEIVGQSRTACRHLYPDAYRYMGFDRIDACVKEAVDETIESASSPQLSRFHSVLSEDVRYRRDRGPVPASQLATPVDQD